MYLFFLCLYFLWLATQNLLLPWVYRQRLLPADVVGALMASKEAVLGIAILVLAHRAVSTNRTWRLSLCDKFGVAYLAVLGFYLLFPEWITGAAAPIALRLVSVRSLACLALFYFWGRLSHFSIRELRHLVWFVFLLHVAVAAFGLIEWSLLPTSFWSNTVGAGTFMLDIKGLLEGQNVADGLPANMFRFGVRRLISSYGDPLAMGIASVFPLLLGTAWWFRRGIRSSLVIAMALIGMGLMLTIGRESIGAAALGVALLVVWYGKKGHVIVAILATILVVAMWLPGAADYVTDTITFREASAATHLRYLQRGWEQLPEMVVGKGLGAAGGWAYSLAGVQSDVGESSYFELMSQTGILSVLLLCGFLASAAVTTWRDSRNQSDPWLGPAFLAASAHIVARAVMGAFSPSLFGVVPLASFFFFCGAAATASQQTQLYPSIAARRILVLRSLSSERPMATG